MSVILEHHIDDYAAALSNALKQVDKNEIKRAVDTIITAHLSRSTVYVCGNGGSAAISDHFMCDHSKGVCTDTQFIPKVQSLSSNMSLLTAIGNDLSYDEVFSYQLDMFGHAADVLVVVSSSGNSPNIVKALETANKAGMRTIALVGFDGGKAAELADVVLHVPVHNYGIVEDSHQALMHIIAQFIRKKYANKVDIKL